MFKQKKWPFAGASGTEYVFTILSKSKGLPRASGVFMLAYARPRGHMAGWQVTPLCIRHADDMQLSHQNGEGQKSDMDATWNCNFVLLEPDASAREKCACDLNARSSPWVLL